MAGGAGSAGIGSRREALGETGLLAMVGEEKKERGGPSRRPPGLSEELAPSQHCARTSSISFQRRQSRTRCASLFKPSNLVRRARQLSYHVWKNTGAPSHFARLRDPQASHFDVSTFRSRQAPDRATIDVSLLRHSPRHRQSTFRISHLATRSRTPSTIEVPTIRPSLWRTVGFEPLGEQRHTTGLALLH